MRLCKLRMKLFNYVQACRKGDQEFPTKGRQKKIAFSAFSLIDLQPPESKQENENVSTENPEPIAGCNNDISHFGVKKSKKQHLETERLGADSSADSFSGFEINTQVNPEKLSIDDCYFKNWHR